ncbi:STAS domain-containing protein [Sagittula sp. SSi028]|uniref:STAS domain-containing protein n=1 Tax=Sagittula sp. SSi028 TaxID=3400636 RepID=UPI003AF8736C
MQLIKQSDASVTVITVDASRIDAAIAIQFKDMMRAELADAQGRHILNLDRVDFIDSSGLGAIVAAMKLMPAEERLELAGLRPAVDKVFRMTRMDSIFQIHPTLQVALDA